MVNFADSVTYCSSHTSYSKFVFTVHMKHNCFTTVVSFITQYNTCSTWFLDIRTYQLVSEAGQSLLLSTATLNDSNFLKYRFVNILIPLFTDDVDTLSSLVTVDSLLKERTSIILLTKYVTLVIGS